MSKRTIGGSLTVGCILAVLTLALAAREGVTKDPSYSPASSSSLATPQPAATPPDAIYYNATIVTMDPTTPTAQALAITGPSITAVGTNAAVLALKGPNTVMTDLKNNATILPGFIDPHSHASGYGYYDDPSNWLDVSAINIMFKPLPGDRRCTTPTDPQKCFIPVKSHDDVLARITAVVKQREAKGDKTPVLAFNYDPSRLGPTPGCSGVGFQCPNFENGKALDQLNKISTSIPIYVSSESGHISYVNSPALTMVDICQTPGATSSCTSPLINPTQEAALALDGQLNEDLALKAASVFQGTIISKDKISGPAGILRGVRTYAKHGYTVTQEGATTAALMALYAIAAADPDYPVTSALIAYDPTQSNFSKIIELALKARKDFGDNPKLFVPAVKTFADGSPQGYTAFLKDAYANVFPPYVPPLYANPYIGLPDLSQSDLTQRVTQSHQSGLPIIVHTNGAGATQMTLTSFIESQKAFPSPNLRDVALHMPMMDAASIKAFAALGNASVSFLAPNLHFYGLPLCQQVLGRTPPFYAAKSAAQAGLHVTLHSDSPVMPPDPLFMIWVAKTRRVQQPPWYRNANPSQCPPVMGLDEAFTIQQGLEAFTTNAAWAYGLETTMGSVTTGKLANLAILSANPLTMESAPDGLKDIRILGTVHRGRYFKNPDGELPPIWPGTI